MSYQNKYFHASGIERLDNGISAFSDVLFINDIGPYKRGEQYPSGYITVNIKSNTVCIEMNSVPEPLGACYKIYTMDLI